MTPSGIDTPEQRAERARHAGNRDRCPRHHRVLTPAGECPECSSQTDSERRDPGEQPERYDGEVTVELDIERALRTLERTRAVARTPDQTQQATLAKWGETA